MVPQPVKYVLETLERAGFAACAVGGCVRDTLLGRVPSDWDVTTAARPEQVLALFGGYAIPTGLRHGTVTVRAEGMSLEVTTFRADGAYTDHRRPDTVIFSDALEDDLCRRDLTVNAMAMDVRGHITDLFGGREDLQNGILRCVGDPECRFEEDALRILRTLRFAAVLGFAIEPVTAAALRRKESLLTYIAPERVLSEMDRLLCGAFVLRVLLDYPDVLEVCLPEITPCVGFDQKNRHHIYDVWAHTAHAVAAAPADKTLRWAMLLHDLGKPACFTCGEDGVGHFYGHPKASAELAETVCRRMRMDNRTAQRVVALVRWHDRDIPRTEKAIARAVSQLGEDAFRQLLEVKRADNAAQSPDDRHRLADIRQAEDILDAGADVITLGNHTWNRREICTYLDESRYILRPANFLPSLPGQGWSVYETRIGPVAVVNLIGRCNMDFGPDNPFLVADKVLAELGSIPVFVDFHAEATSEKLAMGFYLDGRASAVWGTHTHVQTADERILEKGTGYITDLGMTGPLRSVLGVKPEQSIDLFRGELTSRFEWPAGPGRLCGAVFSVDGASGKCTAVERVAVDD